MGTDIHAHFEIKLNGKWEHYSTPRFKRNYELFSRIAGVRNDYNKIEPISKPKGLPTDLSVTTKFEADRWDEDGHTHTWLNAEEIHQLMEIDFIKDDFHFELDQIGFLCGNGWGAFAQHRNDYPPEIEDIRFVCWFDC